MAFLLQDSAIDNKKRWILKTCLIFMMESNRTVENYLQKTTALVVIILIIIQTRIYIFIYFITFWYWCWCRKQPTLRNFLSIIIGNSKQLLQNWAKKFCRHMEPIPFEAKISKTVLSYLASRDMRRIRFQNTTNICTLKVVNKVISLSSNVTNEYIVSLYNNNIKTSPFRQNQCPTIFL